MPDTAALLDLWLTAGQSTVWLAGGLLVAGRLRRTPAKAHLALLLAAVAAVVTPALSLLVHRLGGGLLVGPEAPALYRLVRPGAAPGYGMPLPPPAPPAWLAWVAGLWLAASGWLAVRVGQAYLSGRRLLRGSRPVADDAFAAAARAAARRLSLGAPELRSSPAVRRPAVWCWGRRPVVLLPDQTPAGLTAADWEAVLTHEMAHAARRDHLNALAAELVVVLLPWQPLAWLARRELGLYGECACDDWALAAGTPEEDYAAALLALWKALAAAPRRPRLLLAATGHLGARLRRMLHDRRRSAAGLRRSWVAAAAALAVLTALGLALAQARRASEDTIRVRRPPAGGVIRHPLPARHRAGRLFIKAFDRGSRDLPCRHHRREPAGVRSR
jgi:beta-lactamase regulating signal transducer with metallopeptidase domain